MKLDKAIKILTDELNTDETYTEPDLKDALQLGIEALKKLDDIRTCHPLFHNLLLPGETKD